MPNIQSPANGTTLKVQFMEGGSPKNMTGATDPEMWVYEQNGRLHREIGNWDDIANGILQWTQTYTFDPGDWEIRGIATLSGARVPTLRGQFTVDP